MFEKIIRIFFLISVYTLFYGCNNDTESNRYKKISSELKATKQIRFIGQWLNEGKREKLVRNFVRKYEFENQDVDILLDFPENIFLQGDNTQTNEEFVAQIIKEEKPEWDIIRINNQYNEVTALCGDSLWPQKYLVDFSDYPEFKNNTMPALISDEVKDYWKGIIPGPFIEGQYYALWSNAEVAQKLGIEIKQIGMTVNDFKGYIKAVDDYNQNNPNEYIVPFYDGADWGTIMPLAYQIYASIINSKQKLYEANVTIEKLEAWYEVLKIFEELNAYGFAKHAGEFNWMECSNKILQGKALFYINGSWMYNIWDRMDSKLVHNCYPNEFPVVNETDIFPGNYLVMWAVLKKSPNKDEAVKLLMAMNQPEVGDMWVNYTKSPTGIKTKISTASFGADQYEKFTKHIQLKYSNDLYQVGPYLNKYILGVQRANHSSYLYEVVRGEITANEAYKNILRDADLNK